MMQGGKPKKPAAPEVHMSPERKAEFKKQYPTPELRAEARARIKAGRPARVAARKAADTAAPAGKGKVTTTVTNTTLTNTTGINPTTPAAARKIVDTLIKAQKGKTPAAKTPAGKMVSKKTPGDVERAMVEAQIRKVYGGRLPY